MQSITRRGFIKTGGAATLALGAPLPVVAQTPRADTPQRLVRFDSDGVIFTPAEYAALLVDLARTSLLVPDRYTEGGVVEQLELRFAAITGKERAIFLPSGTMANQLALRVLAGDASKIFVQDTSHVFRDEADAAQTVHGKRLIPLAPGRATFTLEELERAVRDVQTGEVFQTGIGAISIENPVRRVDGAIFGIEETRRIAAFARANRLRLHLDGARLFMASSYSGVGIRDYAAPFDTVYISLYKYLGAGAGAMLCGDKAVLDPIPHLVKIYGGVMYRNWHNAAVALHVLDGFEDRFGRARVRAEALFASLNATGMFVVTHASGASNIHRCSVPGVDAAKFRQRLADRWNIRVPPAENGGSFPLFVNETLLLASNEYLAEAFGEARRSAA